MSSGIVRLKPDKGGDKIDALHVRMVVSNQSSDAPWTVEPQSQSVSFANVGGRTAPLFVQSDASSSSASVVNRGEIRTFDLYYRLPDSKASAETIPEFDFHWQVKAGDRLVTESTSFDRVAVHYDAAPVYPFYGSYPYAYPYGGYPFGFGAGFGFGWEPSPPVIVVPPSAPAPPPSKPVIVGH